MLAMVPRVSLAHPSMVLARRHHSLVLPVPRRGGLRLSARAARPVGHMTITVITGADEGIGYGRDPAPSTW